MTYLKMISKTALMGMVAAALGTACMSASAQSVPAPLDLGPKESLSIKSANGTYAFSVEIADNREEQNRGLMFRDSLGENDGMLFEFEKPKIASIWMKNTAIPLDIIFVRSNGKILKIVHSATPYSLRSASSEAEVAAVLEIPGGRAKELGISPSDIVTHTFFGNISSDSDK